MLEGATFAHLEQVDDETNIFLLLVIFLPFRVFLR